MADARKRRTFVWQPEYAAQYDMLAQKYTPEALEKALLGVLWGIATNPQEFEKVTWNIYQASTRPLGLSVPAFKLRFGMGDSEDEVVLLWIEESVLE